MSKEWSRSTRYLVFILILIFSVWFLYISRALLSPLAIAALLAYILNPLVTFVNKRAKLERSWVIVIVYLLSLSALVLVSIILVQFYADQMQTFAQQIQTIVSQLQEQLYAISFNLLGMEIHLNTLLPENGSIITDFVRPDLALQLLQSTSANVGWILVVLVTTFYLLKDWDKLRSWLFKWAPPDYGSDMRRLYVQVTQVWNRYLHGQLRLSLIVGFFTGAAALLIGLPGALIFGVFAAVFDVLLTVGPVLVTIGAAIVALFAGSTVLPVSNKLFVLIVLAAFGGIQALENIWLRPRIMSHHLNIHPAIVFVAIVASLALGGILMALIIIPVLGSAAVIGRYLYCKLFKLDPWPEETAAEAATTSSKSAAPAA